MVQGVITHRPQWAQYQSREMVEPSEVAPSEAVPSEVVPSGAAPSEVAPGDAVLSEVVPGNGEPGDPVPGNQPVTESPKPATKGKLPKVPAKDLPARTKGGKKGGQIEVNKDGYVVAINGRRIF